jgi:D-sedoheptulose 7-phosphate isomerase
VKSESRGPLERQARAALRDAGTALARLERACSRSVAAAAEAMIACLQGGGSVYFCGNGGSAADAQHLAAELAGRFFVERPALAAVALTTNTSALTAIGNDYGFDAVFARQLEAMGSPGDVLVAISTSGTSANVIQAIQVAHERGMTVIGMTGRRGERFAALCDVPLVTPSVATPRVQEGHIAMGHAICELVERELFRGVIPARPARRSARGRTASGGAGRRSAAARGSAGGRNARRSRSRATRRS